MSARCASLISGSPRTPLTSRTSKSAQAAIGLPQYVGAFEEASIDGEMLFCLGDHDLKTELGVSSKLHRRKIWRKFKAKCEEAE